jgi:hypothetical protein
MANPFRCNTYKKPEGPAFQRFNVQMRFVDPKRLCGTSVGGKDEL